MSYEHQSKPAKENTTKIVKLSKNYCRRIKVIYKNGKLSEKLRL